MTISRARILESIDAYSRDFGHDYYSRFPRMLGNEDHVYHIAARMTLYRDAHHWAILIEHLSYMPRGGSTEAVHLCVHPFGNCLRRYPTSTSAFWKATCSNPVRYFPRPPKHDDTFWEYVPACVQALETLRGKRIPVARQQKAYCTLGLSGLENPLGLHLSCVLRTVAQSYRDDIFATDRQLLSHLRIRIPKFLRLNDWHHPFLYEDEMPSEVATIRQLAKALATGDRHEYQSPGIPSCHWRFWQSPHEMLENDPVDDDELELGP